MQQQLCQTKVHDVDELKQGRLCLAHGLEQSVSNDAIIGGANVSVHVFVSNENIKHLILLKSTQYANF